MRSRPPAPDSNASSHTAGGAKGEAAPDAPASPRARSRHAAERCLAAADAPSTVRAYTADWTHFSQWCAARGLTPMPASPGLVGDDLSGLGEGYARSTLRRKVAAIARAQRHAGHPLDTCHPSIRDALRGIGRTHGSPPKRAQALATEEVQRLWRLAMTVLWACVIVPCSSWPSPARCGGPSCAAPRWRISPGSRGASSCRSRAQRPMPRAKAPASAPARQERGHLPSPGGHAPQHDTPGSAERRGRAPGRAEAGMPGRDQGQPARASLAAQAAGRVRHRGLPSPRARRGDHGPQPAPQPRHHAQLCPALQAQPCQPSQPSREGRPVARSVGKLHVRGQQVGVKAWRGSQPSRAVAAASKSSEMDVRTRRFEPALVIDAMTVL